MVPSEEVVGRASFGMTMSLTFSKHRTMARSRNKRAAEDASPGSNARRSRRGTLDNLPTSYFVRRTMSTSPCV